MAKEKNDEATRAASDRQEKRIAEYLGWKRTSNSGATAFQKGDIYSPRYLGDCKTHLQKTNTVIIYKTHWNKIQNEAMGEFKKPILFCDNGTQEILDTWCVVPKSVVKDSRLTNCICTGWCMRKRTNIVIDTTMLKARMTKLDLENSYFLNGFDDTVLMRLDAFKNILDN